MRCSGKEMVRLGYAIVLSVFFIAPAMGAPSDLTKRNHVEAEEHDEFKDNSFLIEEAYNQEPGEVQHIFNAVRMWDREGGVRTRSWGFLFTQEWPLWSQTHQFSYAVPYESTSVGPEEIGGIGDLFLNYRFQSVMESADRPAVALRLSLILPTGDEAEGLGNGETGYQTNLAISKLAEPFYLHLNAGATFIPGVRRRLAGGLSSEEDLLGFNFGGSAIYRLRPMLNFLFEFVATRDQAISEGGGKEETVSLVFSPGIRYAVNRPGDVQHAFGIGFPIALSETAPDWGVFLYYSLEHLF